MSSSTESKSNAHFRVVDLSANPNIPQLASMLQEVSSTKDPSAMLGQFGPWVAKRAPRDGFASLSRRGLEEGCYKFTRVLTENSGNPDSSTPPHNPWNTWDAIETHRGGLIWELIRTPEPKLINHADLTKDPILAKVLGPRAKDYRAIAAIPAYENGEAINWSLSFQCDPEWTDLEAFETGFLDLNMMGTATRNLVSRKKVEELNAELQDQFEQMGRIQRALIPASNPTLDGYTLATSYKPSQFAGGDFYDYFQFPDGKLGVMIADVAGHGAAAATVMAMLGAYIRTYAEQQVLAKNYSDPVGAAKYLNNHLFESSLPNIFVTAFISILDSATGSIHWTRCGHNPPRIRGVDGSLRSLVNPGSFPLGITPDLPEVSLSSTLAPGETLVMYTDGITEAARPADNEAGFEMFGEDRLDLALSECSGQPQCVIDSINRAVAEFSGSDHAKDDQTIVVVRHNHPDDEANDQKSDSL
tara:strand:- start:144352 stop:145767 length:1416 start_codon:yes stop_codon:yes gene_type:complete